jgi:hypothetical protein
MTVAMQQAKDSDDKEDRIVPLRGMQKAMITQAQIKQALVITVMLIASAGGSLIAVACKAIQRYYRLPYVGFAFDHCYHHLCRWHKTLRLPKARSRLGTSVLQLAERWGQLYYTV